MGRCWVAFRLKMMDLIAGKHVASCMPLGLAPDQTGNYWSCPNKMELKVAVAQFIQTV